MSKRKRKKIPAEMVTTTVTQLNHEGRGIAHINGKTTFLFGGLTGENVQFRYTQMHRHYDEGAVTTALTTSQDRVIPQCAHFGVCGGCSLQHLSPDAQRLHKQSVLLEHFQAQANCQPETVLPAITGDTWEYRRKARLSIRYVPKKNMVLVGFRERGSSYVAQINECEILHPSVGRKIKALSELFMQCEAKQSIAQIEVAVGDNATAIVLRHLTELSSNDLQRIIDFAKENQWQLYLQPGGPETVHAIYPENLESLYYDIPTENIRMQFLPTQFTQINPVINLKMIARAMALLDLQETDRVLDLFCGIGNFSLPIAKHCAQVVGVEGAENAIHQAKQNTEDNHITNTSFYTHDLSQDCTDANWAKQSYDKILLDPPRVGAIEILPMVAVWQPRRIVYVSCNPMTLARDTKLLIDQGYRLESAGVMDMFPHTEHVEAIALFVKVL